MVSVPDWSKLGRLLEHAKTTPATPAAQNRYARFKEEEAIKQAEEHGYFLNVTRQFLEKNFLPPNQEKDGPGDQRKPRSILDEETPKIDLAEIVFIKLMRGPLRNLGSMGMCVGLKICVLSNNYITTIEGLAACTQLIKLDLHSNQIATVPGAQFWAGMKSLQFLHLHDNPIGKAENLHYLAGAPRLSALTMFDTPLSLKKNYRHHVVNTLWSLKALDEFVISDEEIIEEADFGGQFQAQHPNFAINLCPPTPEDSSYEDELAVLLQVNSCINYIQAHSSPVLLIQRFVRGHLTRRLLKRRQDMQIWASVIIQRFYRRWKGLPSPKSALIIPPPPGTPDHQCLAGPGAVDVLKIDYDSYLRNRRPGSTGISEVGSRGSRKSARLLLEGKPVRVKPPNTPPNSSSPEPRKRKNLFINLAKLHNSTLQNLQDESVAMEINFPSEFSFVPSEKTRIQPGFTERKKVQKKAEPEKKRQVIKTVKQFFGPMVESIPSPEPKEVSPQSGEDEVPLVTFRLNGMKKKIRYMDATLDMFISRKEAGRDVREAEMDYHHKVDLAPKPTIPKKAGPTHEEQVLAKMKGALPEFTCLAAVHKAYKERTKAQKHTVKTEQIQSLKEHRDGAKQRIQACQDERRKQILQSREREQHRIEEELERREMNTQNSVNKYIEHHNKSSHHRRQRRNEKPFLVEFGAQNTSIAKALTRHDHRSVLTDQQCQKASAVSSHRENMREQQEVVRKYMEHRKLMWQTETALHKAALDSKMLQEANDRLLQARQHVAQQRARSANIEEAAFVLPSISNHSLTGTSQDEEVHQRAHSTGGIVDPALHLTQTKLTRLSTAAV